MSSLQKSERTSVQVATFQASLSLANGIVNGGSMLAMTENSLTIANNLNKPILRSLFKGNDNMCFNVVSILMKRFLNAFSFTTKLNATQIEILVVDTIALFGYESLEDVVLFLRMARTGRFGTAKRGIDSNLIFSEWYPMYMELKAQERESVKQQQKNQQISYEKEVQKFYKKHEKQQKDLEQKQSVKEFIDDTVKGFDRQLLEDTIVSWSKDNKLKGYVSLLKLKRKTIK